MHNGIITNYKKLRASLASCGLECEGETDTEVVAKLAMRLHGQNPCSNFQELACTLVEGLEGNFSFLMKSRHYPNEIIAVKKGSPLIVGLLPQGNWQPDLIHLSLTLKNHSQSAEPESPSITSNGDVCTDSIIAATPQMPNSGPAEFFLASDPSAIVRYTKRMVFLEDNDVAHIQGGRLSLYNNTEATANFRDIKIVDNLTGETPSKGNFQHFMRKEIFEQPEAIENALKNRLNIDTQKITLNGLSLYMDVIRKCSRIVFVACGSSHYACLAAREVFEMLNDITVSVEIASDFLDRSVRISGNAAYVFVSQSGETAECLVSLQYCLEQGGLTIGIVNVVNSSIARLTHCGVYLNAGVEIGVATTKAYTSQLVVLVLFALALSEHFESTRGRREEIIHGLHLLPDHVRKVLALDQSMKSLCEKTLVESSRMLVLGRGYQFSTALEAALKIKEVAYVHCEAVMSGELKHGVLALVDQGFPVVMIATRDASFSRTLNSYEQRTYSRNKNMTIS